MGVDEVFSRTFHDVYLRAYVSVYAGMKEMRLQTIVFDR